jgi:dipeptidyl aminopeptidase/acylaminoacyl peptidase
MRTVNLTWRAALHRGPGCVGPDKAGPSTFGVRRLDGAFPTDQGKTKAASSRRTPDATALVPIFVLLLAIFSFMSSALPSQVNPLQESSQSAGPRGERSRLVFKDQVVPHWFHDHTRFWYRNDLKGGAREFVLVDAARATRQPAFDHAKLAAALSQAAGAEYRADRLPFELIEFIDDSRVIRFKVGDATWKCDLTAYDCSKAEAGAASSATHESEATPGSPEERRRQRDQSESDNTARGGQSPDGKWSALIKDYNVFLRSKDDRREIRLSQDGQDRLAYGRLSWSPDSRTLVAFRIEPGERKEVYLVQSSPPGGGRARLQSRPYALPGDKFTTYEVNVFDVAAGQQIKPPADRLEHEWLAPRVRWNRDGSHFTYPQTDRGHQRFRLIDVDAHTGAVRNLIDEKSGTFIWTAHTENLRLNFVNWLEQTEELVYVSERDGWRHLYLIDAAAGKIKNQITQGEYVVRGIDHIDEGARQIWFHASGRNLEQDPYLIHYYRVNFDGTGLVALTEGNGNHSLQYSPDRKYIIDTYSRVDLPPVNELRRVADGKLVCKLEEADISELRASGWQPPEVFVAKGRDGRTDIWGVISRPRDLDPGRKYPVIEDIYAGPQGSFVPKTFSPASRYESLTKLGFMVVKIDGMGTANRSKAFHDVCWKNLKDAGFSDRIPWMKAAAAKYTYMDLSRVGIYGNSAGAQNAAAAVLFHPEFYKVAVASCGCHDNRMDKASWNEQWMGYPVGPQYSECSNIDNAHRLRGKLFLIVGEMDTNVPPESTFRFVDALIKAGKDFDLLVIPGAGHGMGGAYGQRRMQDFFARHLLGAEPPDRNAENGKAGG